MDHCVQRPGFLQADLRFPIEAGQVLLSRNLDAQAALVRPYDGLPVDRRRIDQVEGLLADGQRQRSRIDSDDLALLTTADLPLELRTIRTQCQGHGYLPSARAVCGEYEMNPPQRPIVPPAGNGQDLRGDRLAVAEQHKPAG
jgi:hypothetical protein